MANLDKELNKIKHAIYGKDVRGSIHDGIDKVNKESEESKGKSDKAIKDSNKAKTDSSYAASASNSAISVANTSNDKSDDTQQQLDNIVLRDGNDIAEVVQARGNEHLLKDRLNKANQQLVETVKEGVIYV